MKRLSRSRPLILIHLLVLYLAAITAQTGFAQNTPAVSDIEALKAEIEALKKLTPSQSHAMADVDYQFANLWFAGQAANWPLAEFYLNEARSHIGWMVRIRPIRKTSSGDLDLQAMWQTIDAGYFVPLKTTISNKNGAAFSEQYKLTMNGCYACHVAAEKPYLRPHIPDAPASQMIEMKPQQ